MSKSPVFISVLLLSVLHELILFSPVLADNPSAPAPRPSMPAILVRDGQIKVDGKLSEWPSDSFEAAYERTAEDKTHLNFLRTPEGEWTGKQDASFTVRAAVDAHNLYIGATVRDQLLFNDSTPDNPWMGDDFEIFLDANPAATRYGKGTNGNFLQLIFVADHVMPGTDGTMIWKADKHPGVRAATRLTPLGYNIEIQVPKVILPNWRDHQDMDSIGFDATIGDLDTPGVTGHDAAPKCMQFLLSPYAHFLSASQLGELRFDHERNQSKRMGKESPPDLSGYDNAQSMLDAWDEPNLNVAVNLALTHPNLARKTALFILTKRADLDFDAGLVLPILREKPEATELGALQDARIYAMVLLSGRHKLPAAEVLNLYGNDPDPLLRQTAIYCAGTNGDKDAIPALKELYAASEGRNRELLSVALARLGDATATGDLQGYVKRDQGQPFGVLCAALLKQVMAPAP